jgi:hypothetical protein
MAAKSAVLRFLKPVLILSKWTGTLPVLFEESDSIVHSRFHEIMGQFIALLIAVTNSYVAYTKFYSQISKYKVSAVTTVVGDLFLIASNLSIYVFISKYKSVAQTITDLVELERRLKNGSEMLQKTSSFRNYLIGLQTFYILLNIREHFYLDDFQITDSIMGYLKEFLIITIELQMLFLVRILKYFYGDLNRELSSCKTLNEKAILEYRSYLRTLQQATEDIDKYFGMCVLLFLYTLYVYICCDVFWIWCLYLADEDTLTKLERILFLGISWGGFDLIRVLSYFWITADFINEVSYRYK